MSKSNKLSLEEQADRNHLEQTVLDSIQSAQRELPKDVARHAYLWNFEQLNEMVAILGGLQSAQRVQCTGEVTEVSESKRGRPGGSGYFEDKLIKGYGPYRYLRYWKNGHRRSVYVGKFTEETRNTTGARDV